MHLNVIYSRKEILVSSIIPKNELENVDFCPSLLGQKLFVRFLEELKKSKSSFEINWPLDNWIHRYLGNFFEFCLQNHTDRTTIFRLFKTRNHPQNLTRTQQYRQMSPHSLRPSVHDEDGAPRRT